MDDDDKPLGGLAIAIYEANAAMREGGRELLNAIRPYLQRIPLWLSPLALLLLLLARLVIGE